MVLLKLMYLNICKGHGKTSEGEKVKAEYSRNRQRPQTVTNEMGKRRSTQGREPLGQSWKASPRYLDPSKEKVDCVHIIVLSLPEGQELKVCIRVWLLQELSHQLVHFQGSEYVETHSHNGELPQRSHEECQRSQGDLKGCSKVNSQRRARTGDNPLLAVH